jgi:hypothetical protein
MADEAKTTTIDLTPTWAGVAHIYIMALQNGTEEGQASAKREIHHMAQVADKAVFYRALLQKYIQRIGDTEGATTFSAALDRSDLFTEAEKAELRNLETEE